LGSSLKHNCSKILDDIHNRRLHQKTTKARNKISLPVKTYYPNIVSPLPNETQNKIQAF
jgi:hypothetical protein